jgi:acyl dehydratase
MLSEMLTIRSFDELRGLIGHEVGASDWFVVTQEMVDRFASLTSDSQWIHVDRERAERESPYGTTIAHGFLSLSLMSHLFRETVRIQAGQKMNINYGFNRVRFPAPVRTGSRIRLHVVLNNVREVEQGVECAWGMRVESEGQEKPAVAAEWLTRMYV